MANLDDILGKKQELKDDEDWFPIGGICEQCYFPLDLGVYYPDKKRLKTRCDNGHVGYVDMDLGNG